MGRVSIPFALHAQLVYLHNEQVSQGQHNSEPQAITHKRVKKFFGCGSAVPKSNREAASSALILPLTLREAPSCAKVYRLMLEFAMITYQTSCYDSL